MDNGIPYSIPLVADAEMRARAVAIYERLKGRRSVRQFSRKPVPDGVLEDAIRAAGTAPNGANLQPWHFVIVRDDAIKSEIRIAAEQEESAFYGGRACDEWLEALAPLGTHASKPFLAEAPALIAIFSKSKILNASGETKQTYYAKESTGIATGFLISALHEVGLATLTHTPSPMHFLNQILQRPGTEKPFLLLVVGFPAEGCRVPEITKLPLEDFCTVF